MSAAHAMADANIVSFARLPAGGIKRRGADPARGLAEHWRQRVAAAKPGQVLSYWHGFIAMERERGLFRKVPLPSEPGESPAPGAAALERRALGLLADAVYRSAEMGLVLLVQRRLGPEEFQYLAIRTTRV